MKESTRKVVLKKRAKEFRDLFLKSGWSQVEAAIQLKLSDSNYVNMILHGRSEPSETLLELLRVKVVNPDLLRLMESLEYFKPEVYPRVMSALQAFISLLKLTMM